MNHATLRDFFLVAPMIYEAVGRLAVQNFKAAQMEQLKDCQERFRAAMSRRDAEAMVVENNGSQAIIGETANSAYLSPASASRRTTTCGSGRPSSGRPTMRWKRAGEGREHHDEIISAIAEKDEAAVVRLVFEHWELSRGNMEMFIAPKA